MNRYVVLTLLVGIVSASLATASSADTAATTTFYVATNGRDTWSGTLALPNAQATDGPFATLARALTATRQARSQAGGKTRTMRIVLRAGSYRPKRMLELGVRDSGLTIQAAAGEKVILSGGRRISGWRPYKHGIMRADISASGLADYAFGELYYNGRRQPLARVPNFDPEHPRTGGFAYNAGVVEKASKTKFRYDPEQIGPSKWARPGWAIVDFFPGPNYGNTVSRLKRVDTKAHVLETRHGRYALQPGDRFYVRRVFEELDAPGEWYVDDDSKTLFFWPPDEKLATSEVVVPALDSLFKLKGDAGSGKFVERVTFTRLAMQDCRGAAVDMTAARRCAVTACGFRNVMTAVTLGDETHGCRVVGCDITQTGGHGISMIGTPEHHERVSHHLVDNNYIYDFGWTKKEVAGVFLSCVSHCTVSHNRIHDGPRWGIAQNAGNNNTFAYNHLHHLNQETCDTGAIYTVTCAGGWDRWMVVETNRLSRGHEIHHNLIHNTGGYGKVRPGLWEMPHYCWGIYLDLASSGYHVHDNVVYNTYLGGFMIGGGQDNVCENNVFVGGRTCQIYFCPWIKMRHHFPMARNRVERNIIAYSAPDAFLYKLSPRFQDAFGAFKKNLVFNHGGPLRVQAGKLAKAGSWDQWRKRGQDEGTLVADPMFVDAAGRDFRLRPESPAFGLGFKPIDLGKVGTYESPDRYTWPRPEIVPRREKPITRSTYRPPVKPAVALPQYTAVRLAAPPKIDGRLDEWPFADRRRVMTLREDPSGAPAAAPASQACVGYDGDALYVAIRNQVTHPKGLVSTRGWGASDGVEIALQDAFADRPGPILNLYGYPDGHFESVTTAGATEEQAARLGAAVAYASAVGADHWSCEWRIRFAGMGFTPRSAPKILFNLGVCKLAQRAWVILAGTGAQTYIVRNAAGLVFEE